MPRYIDAEKVEKWSYSEPRYSDSVNDRTDLRDFLLSLPTLSPDEVRGVGRWIVKQTATGKDYTICSACKTDFKFRTDKGTLARLDMRGMPFCPNCGAKMKGVEDKS